MRVFDTKSCIEKFKLTHGNKYDYHKVDYKGTKSKVIIICPNHGEFLQQPNSHISGKGCPECNFFNRRLTYDNFIKRANLKHSNKYDYKESKFKTARDKVQIICPVHGKFLQLVRNHLYGDGCPFCQTSKGEIEIEKYLSKLGIKYLKQHSFEDCKFKFNLRFDFYLPDENICIEYDGRQHFMPIFGDDKLKDVQLKDKIKNEYCIQNNIPLYRISFKDDIESKMASKFGK